jgi:DNA-directed RNA polymerase alpha subunit
LVEDRAQSVATDLQYEAKNRLESIEHIKACLKSDFPKLEEMIRKEAEDREESDAQLDLQLSQEMVSHCQDYYS